MINFSAEFYTRNRQRLVEACPDSLIFIAASSRLQYSADMAYPFRQDTSFWYLTGINEPDIVLVIDTGTKKSQLILPNLNDYQQEWDGALDKPELTSCSGISSFSDSKYITQLVKNANARGLNICSLEPLPEVVAPYGFYSNPARSRLTKTLSDTIGGRSKSKKIKDIRLDIARLRQIKQSEEIEAIQSAIDITGRALGYIKSRLAGFKTEKDLELAITAEIFKLGAAGHAYEPIVASGKNAATIHYMKNNQNIKSNELLLLDVGALVDGYAADISRTWAVGSPTDRQKEIFAAVIKLQQQAFDLLKAGVVLKEYQDKMENFAKVAVTKLGKTMTKYPHGFSHFLGLDVHDAGDYHSPLAEGSVITVEPGLYFADEGIGVRIEDNVLVTKNGFKILSDDIPKSL
jgi:Xaa-Pro aminopeptidase